MKILTVVDTRVCVCLFFRLQVWSSQRYYSGSCSDDLEEQRQCSCVIAVPASSCLLSHLSRLSHGHLTLFAASVKLMYCYCLTIVVNRAFECFIEFRASENLRDSNPIRIAARWNVLVVL